PRAGMTHVTVVYFEAGEASSGQALEPTIELEADVRTSWLAAVTQGDVHPAERAGRIAEALAGIASIPGQSTVAVGAARSGSAIGPEPVRLRGVMKPKAAAAWLLAAYPPPKDDPILVAQVQANLASLRLPSPAAPAA